MSDFDNLYNDTVRGGFENKESNADLLSKKRNIIHEFFSNKITQILVLILWIVFAVNAITSVISIILSFGVPNSSPILSLIIAGIGLWIAFLVPYGFYLIHNGSKESNPEKYIKGLETLKQFIKITKIILIIIAAIFGLSILLMLSVAIGLALITGIIVGLIFWLVFFIIAIFSNYVDDLLGAYRLEDIDLPLADRIRTYFIVILVLSLIGFILSYSMLSNLSEYGDLFEGTLYEELVLEDYEFGPMDFLSPILTISELGFFIYYTKQYDVFAVEANIENKKNIQEYQAAKAAELE